MLADRIVEFSRSTGNRLQQRFETLIDRVLIQDYDSRNFLINYQDPVTQELLALQSFSTSQKERREFSEKLRERKKEIMHAQNPDLLIQEAYFRRRKQESDQLIESVLDDLVIVP